MATVLQPLLEGGEFNFNGEEFVFREDGIACFDIKRRFDGRLMERDI